jgi:hypothetical protein
MEKRAPHSSNQEGYGSTYKDEPGMTEVNSEVEDQSYTEWQDEAHEPKGDAIKAWKMWTVQQVIPALLVCSLGFVRVSFNI